MFIFNIIYATSINITFRVKDQVGTLYIKAIFLPTLPKYDLLFSPATYFVSCQSVIDNLYLPIFPSRLPQKGPGFDQKLLYNFITQLQWSVYFNNGLVVNLNWFQRDIPKCVFSPEGGSLSWELDHSLTQSLTLSFLCNHMNKISPWEYLSS